MPESTIGKFNGEYTLRNVDTGEHRTFRIRTQPKDAGFAPGARIVSLLTGPTLRQPTTFGHNDSSYTGFGFLHEDHTPMIHLYHKRDNPTFRYYAKLLQALEQDTDQVTIGDRTYDILLSTLCRKCNRKLTTPESIKSGIGPVCGGRV